MCFKNSLVVALVLILFPYALTYAEDITTTKMQAPASASGKSHRDKVSVYHDKGMTRMSGRKRFRVSIRSNVDPLPLSRIHSWTVHIETPDGIAVEDAQIGVYGGMPAHKHGLPTKPKVTAKLGRGDYQIDGVKFNMPGVWELILIITADGKRDKAKFSVDLP
jgi:hypothetical protein